LGGAFATGGSKRSRACRGASGPMNGACRFRRRRCAIPYEHRQLCPRPIACGPSTRPLRSAIGNAMDAPLEASPWPNTPLQADGLGALKGALQGVAARHRGGLIPWIFAPKAGRHD
jgi:hypothetical protein